MPPADLDLGDMTFRQKPSARERAKCSAWAKCLGMPGDCDQARRSTSRTKRRESQAASAAGSVSVGGHDGAGVHIGGRFCSLGPVGIADRFLLVGKHI